LALNRGTRLGSYEITALLGVGGMGEVYRARDTRLNRDVALKLLPATAAADAERRERFEREAQTIAALNHPNIVTIHSVEQADGDFFLTMELVEGRSLAHVIPKTGLPLDQLLKIAIPVADAMAAAHQKGITHRDLKPANVMLGEGEQAGRVKVLDFGLAKLAEAPAATATGVTALATAPITGEGRILGTVAYMSPEQAEGKLIDARSDLFSLGVILYEMATGQRPFTGDTSISIISSIVKDTPKSVTELNPALPRDLGRIVRRALTKDVDRRYQTAKDVRNDLEELKASLDSGEVLATSGATLGRTTDRTRATQNRGTRNVVAAVVATAVVAVTGMYVFSSRRALPAMFPPATALQGLKITALTASGTAARPAISPDGKYVAYVQRSQLTAPDGPVVSASSIWIRQTATQSNVQIVAPEPRVGVGGLTVTPDGNYIDYVRIRSVGAGNGELWRVSFLGGAPKKLVEDVFTPIGWSPDGRHMAFVRDDLGRGAVELMVADADGGDAHVLATRHNLAQFDSLLHLARPSVRPAWSLDGRVIAVPGSILTPDIQEQIVFVDSTTGAEHAVPVQGIVYGLDWLDADSLVLDQETEITGPSQLWRLAYPGGAVTRLTNDLGSYVDISVTAARDTLVTTKTDRHVSIWVTDGSRADAKEILHGIQSSGTSDDVVWAPDRLFFTSTIGGHRSISSINPDGGTPQEVVSQGMWPGVTSDGRTLTFNSTDPSRPGVWKMTDGGRPVQVRKGPTGWPRVTRDDRSVVFTALTSGDPQSLWMVAIDGGTPIQLANRFAATPALSPDGKAVAFQSEDEQGRIATAVCNLPSCASLRFVPLNVNGQRIGWTPDSTGFILPAGAPQNLWAEPLDMKPPRQITHFTDDAQIADASWSRDGKRLAVSRTTSMNDIVLIKGLKP
jgi:Tol biopolymer transport system component